MEYRITRPRCYGERTPGHKDFSARQGHYALAANADEAKRIVRERLGLRDDEPLDVQEWSA